MQRWQFLRISSKVPMRFLPVRFLALLLLSLTPVALNSCAISQPTKPFSSEALPTEAIAEISEVRSFPVRVKYLNATSAKPASVGGPLKVDESVSTEDSSTAQLTMRNGVIFRIGGVSNLKIKPQNQVEFTSGKLVAWSASDRKAPAQIQTPFGEISSNGGTIYLEIPPKAAEDRRIIALDGTVTVLLKQSSSIVTVGKGEEVRIKADGKATTPARVDKETIEKRIANNNLIFGFSSQLASLNQIIAEFGVTSTVKEASTLQFRRSDLPTKPTEAAKPPKVNYTSGAAANDKSDKNDKSDRYDRYEPPVERRREDPTTARNAEPTAPEKTSEPSPANTAAPISPPDPRPITSNPVAAPVEPVRPPQPAPLEPPPQPVQPEIPAPEPPPIAPKPKN
jgi:hypothetical protein